MAFFSFLTSVAIDFEGAQRLSVEAQTQIDAAESFLRKLESAGVTVPATVRTALDLATSKFAGATVALQRAVANKDSDPAAAQKDVDRAKDAFRVARAQAAAALAEMNTIPGATVGTTAGATSGGITAAGAGAPTSGTAAEAKKPGISKAVIFGGAGVAVLAAFAFVLTRPRVTRRR